MAVIALLALVSGTAARAAVPGPNIDGSEIQIDSGTYLPPEPLSQTFTESVDGVTGTLVTAAVGPNGMPSVSASASTVSAVDGGRVLGAFNYFYAVEGATGPVPVDVSYTLKTTANGYGTSIAGIYVGTAENPLGNFNDIIHEYSPDGLFHHTEKSATYSGSAVEGETYEVLLGANASVGSPNATATASSDPYIYIDPAYLAAHPGVSLEISAGVGNVGPVPEPASWASMLAGVGLLGIRRRQTGKKR